jgi:hypothetical protein
VDIFHDQHVQRAWLADLRQQGHEQALAGGAGPAQLQQLPAELGGHVKQRAEWPRGKQAVAGAPQPAGVRRRVLQLLDQRRLADAGFPGDQDEPAVAPPGLSRVALQGGQLRFALQQPHLCHCAPARDRMPPGRPVLRVAPLAVASGRPDQRLRSVSALS